MNVLHVIHFPVFGGPHNQALRLAAPLEARGFRTIVVVPDQPGNAVDRLRAGGVEVRTMPLGRLRSTADPRSHVAMVAGFPAQVRELRKLIRDERIDIVQIGGLVNPHAAFAARAERVPVVWQLLDTRAPFLVAAAAMMWVRELADVVMATGSAVAQAHPGYGAIADRVIPFFPPVDLGVFAPNSELRSAVRSEWGVPMSGLVVGCVANINPQKGIIDLVKAFALLRSWRPNARLALVGAEYATHATYSAAVREQMASDGLREGRDVVFVGGRDDVERQLAGMDVVALAAAPLSEGITTAILEAMAAGLPVVVTDVGAIREAIRDGTSGFVIQPGDLDSFAIALDRLAADPSLRARMGEEGRVAAEAKFGVDTCVATHVRAYTQALAVRGRAGRMSVGTTPSRFHVGTSVVRLVDGIPTYVEAGARTSHDELGHDHPPVRGHKAAQAAHFDGVAEAEFEIERPRRTPRLYRFLLAEKFRRGMEPIRIGIIGEDALTVCGGSGMDAEYLARAGAIVTSSDLSLGAAKRVRTRAERHELLIQSIVADVEHLPFGDASVGLVAVHDGLHHLDNPYAGLAEMARVARRWVVVSEPARSTITGIAIRLGLALEAEEAGNRVARLEPREVAAFLEARGFAVLRRDRYAMYYPHRPGAVFALLSWSPLYHTVRLGWRIANALVGRYGNKMVVVAERCR